MLELTAISRVKTEKISSIVPLSLNLLPDILKDAFIRGFIYCADADDVRAIKLKETVPDSPASTELKSSFVSLFHTMILSAERYAPRETLTEDSSNPRPERFAVIVTSDMREGRLFAHPISTVTRSSPFTATLWLPEPFIWVFIERNGRFTKIPLDERPYI